MDKLVEDKPPPGWRPPTPMAGEPPPQPTLSQLQEKLEMSTARVHTANALLQDLTPDLLSELWAYPGPPRVTFRTMRGILALLGYELPDFSGPDAWENIKAVLSEVRKMSGVCGFLSRMSGPGRERNRRREE